MQINLWRFSHILSLFWAMSLCLCDEIVGNFSIVVRYPKICLTRENVDFSMFSLVLKRKENLNGPIRLVTYI